MNNILQDLSPTSLITAIEDNLFSWIPVFGKIWESRVNDPPGMIRSVSDVPMSLFNSIMDAQLEQENVDSTIQYIISDARLRKVPALWWVGPSSRPADLAKRLLENGFTVDEDGPGMAVALANLNLNLPIPAGLSVREAQDDVSQWVWCRTMASGFGVPAAKVDFAVNSWHDLLSQVDPEITQAYIAWLDGEPVATSLLQLGGGVAGIFSVATIPEARRKGIGAQVTLYPLLQARDRGYKVGVIESSEMGFGVYQSLGFKEYCRICSYVWRSNAE
jgi:ribosomal protein S18 acetylase RimI-like enzyme